MNARVARLLLLLVGSFAALRLVFAAAAPEPTAFERFVMEPNIVVAASREIGSLASVDSTVAVTVLLAQSPADQLRRMRGVRFDLSHNVGTERIYLDERELAKLRNEVALMERFNTAALGRTGGVTSAQTVHGTEGCWMPNPVRRILCPEIQAAPDWNGLRLWTFGGARFDFRDRTVTELRELVERAVTELDEL
jgi:hypothetical protein